MRCVRAGVHSVGVTRAVYVRVLRVCVQHGCCPRCRCARTVHGARTLWVFACTLCTRCCVQRKCCVRCLHACTGWVGAVWVLCTLYACMCGVCVLRVLGTSYPRVFYGWCVQCRGARARAGAAARVAEVCALGVRVRSAGVARIACACGLCVVRLCVPPPRHTRYTRAPAVPCTACPPTGWVGGWVGGCPHVPPRLLHPPFSACTRVRL